LTDPNRRAHVAAELRRSEEALRAARSLLDLGLYADAVSRAYYAALHAAQALLLTEGVEPRTHRGVSGMLGLHFVVPGRIAPDRAKDLSRLEQFREEADGCRLRPQRGERRGFAWAGLPSCGFTGAGHKMISSRDDARRSGAPTPAGRLALARLLAAR
jgi:hypothetical protein